jgi:hypothetical protein
MVAIALGIAAFACGCADKEQIHAQQMADEASTNAEDEATCRQKAAPGTETYDQCRQGLAAARAQKRVIQYEKRRDFDRVLGAGTSGPSETY